MASRKPHKREATARGSKQTSRRTDSRQDELSSSEGARPSFLEHSESVARAQRIASRVPSVDDEPKKKRRFANPFKLSRTRDNEVTSEEIADETDLVQAEEGEQPRKHRRWPRVLVIVLVALVAAVAIAYAVLSNTSAFVITGIVSEDTEHVSSQDIATLAAVPEGTTLLNYDEAQITANLLHNPWVGEVKVSRIFPDTLRISVTERTVEAVVPLNSGTVVWCLGSGDVWIEPIKVTPEEDQAMAEAALDRAAQMGSLLITDVPSSVSPVAGQPAGDEVFAAVSAYRKGFTKELWDQVVSVSAPSVEGISCTLSNGVEVSLGTPEAISTKEGIIEQILAKYPGRITYINVRVPSNPSYRMIESDTVQEGTGVMGGGYGPNIDEEMRERANSEAAAEESEAQGVGATEAEDQAGDEGEDQAQGEAQVELEGQVEGQVEGQTGAETQVVAQGEGQPEGQDEELSDQSGQQPDQQPAAQVEAQSEELSDDQPQEAAEVHQEQQSDEELEAQEGE